MVTKNYVQDPTPNQSRFPRSQSGVSCTQQSHIKDKETREDAGFRDFETAERSGVTVCADEGHQSPKRPVPTQLSPKDKNNDNHQADFSKTKEKRKG